MEKLGLKYAGKFMVFTKAWQRGGGGGSGFTQH